MSLDPNLIDFCRVLAAGADDGLGELQAEIAGDLLVNSLARHIDIEPDAVRRALGWALAFVDRHLGEPIGVDEMARGAGISASRLHSLFRERFDTLPVRCLASRRMARAR